MNPGGSVAEGFLTADEVAGRLRITLSTLYHWTSQGSIPHFKLGKQLLFSWPDVLDWLETKRRGAMS